MTRLSAPALLLVAVSIAGCTAPPSKTRQASTDSRLSLWNASAREAFNEGALEKSGQLYARALKRARVMDEPQAIAENAYSLAICTWRLGKPAEALRYALEARHEWQRLGSSVHDATVLEARCRSALGDAATARALLTRIVGSAHATAIQRTQALLLEAELELDAGKLAAARLALDRADEVLLATPDVLLRAVRDATLGRIQLAEDQQEGAAMSFDRESLARRQLGHFQEMCAALTRAAHAHEKTGRTLAASDRYFRAARSLLAQGAPQRAEPLAARALELAVSAKPPVDADARSRLEDLLKRCRDAAAALAQNSSP